MSAFIVLPLFVPVMVRLFGGVFQIKKDESIQPPSCLAEVIISL
ncbi:hypothetical protein [Bacillus sp. 0102A]